MAPYNQLFGLGPHHTSADPDCRAFWPMQDDANDNFVQDWSGNGNHAQVSAGATTAMISDTGPNSYLTKGLRLGNINFAHIIQPALSIGNDATSFVWVKVDNDPEPGHFESRTGWGVDGDAITGGGASHYPFTDGNIYSSTWRSSGGSFSNRRNIGNVPEDLTQWNDVTVKTTPGAGGWVYRLNGDTKHTVDGQSNLYTDGGDWNSGRSTNGSIQYYLYGVMAGKTTFARKLSDADEDELRDGPELVNNGDAIIIGGNEVGQTLSFLRTPVFMLPEPFAAGSNGMTALSYQWTRSTDASGAGETPIAGATSDTYTIQEADQGFWVACITRGTNDGGFDPASDLTSNRVEILGGAVSTAWFQQTNGIVGVGLVG